MTAVAGNKYLSISSATGVWQLNLTSSEKRLIIDVGSVTNDIPVEKANIKVPSSLISLNVDVILIVDEGTPTLRVANLQTGSGSSICRDHDLEYIVEGNISVCQLRKPKYILVNLVRKMAQFILEVNTFIAWHTSESTTSVSHLSFKTIFR